MVQRKVVAILVLFTMLALTGVYAETGSAAASVEAYSGASWTEWFCITGGCPAEMMQPDPSGQTTVEEKSKHLHVKGKVEVPPGFVYTAWWLICAEEDQFPCEDIEAVGKLGSGIANNGVFSFAGNAPFSTSELDIVNHGPKVPGSIDEQTKEPEGGCIGFGGDNECAFSAYPIQ